MVTVATVNRLYPSQTSPVVNYHISRWRRGIFHGEFDRISKILDM